MSNRTGSPTSSKWRRRMQAVNGRPLATFCAGYLAGAGAGVTFHPLWVIDGCLLLLAVGWLVWHYRLLSATVILLSAAGVWLGAVQGIRYAWQDDLLWRTLPDNDVVMATGEVMTEPALRRGAYRFVFRADSLSTPQQTFRAPVQIWVSVPVERVDTVFCGERLVLEGRLRNPTPQPGARDNDSFVQYLRRQGVSRTLQPYRVQKMEASGWRLPFSRLRRTLIRNLRRHLPTREGHIVAAIALNDRTGLDNEIRESFRRTGTIHILSPSGTHVSMLAVVVWMTCSWLRLPRRASALAVIAIIWLFASVASGGAPSFRAAVMGTLVAGAVVFQRELDMPTSLACAGFLLAAADAGNLRDPGFQFSFVLVAAIIAASGWLAGGGTDEESPLRRVTRWAIAGIGLSVVCAVASSPLTALYYGQMSLVAPIANLVIALPVQMVTCGGLASAWLPYLPEVVALPVAMSAWLVDESVRLLASLPWASVDAPPPSRAFIAGFYALLFALLLFVSARASQRRTAVAV